MSTTNATAFESVFVGFGSRSYVPDEYLTSHIGVSYGVFDVRAQHAVTAEGIGIHDALTTYYGVMVADKLSLALAQTANIKYHEALNDIALTASILRAAQSAVIGEAVGIALSQQAQQAVKVIEALGLQAALIPAFIYGRSILDQLRVASVLGRFFGASISDVLGIAPLLDGYAVMPDVLTDGVAVASDANPQLIFSATAADTLNVSVTDILQSIIFGDTISDGIQISAAYVSPDSTITTWAMNTRTGAITEYTDFAFNSFARMGLKYLGADSTGLYELTGDDDDGAAIISEIKSGFMQFAGSRFTMFNGIYLGLRGPGDYVLKVDTGDGKSYIYAVNAQDMCTTKIVTGKGMRTRYFAFELISTGQDFDLDSVEFVPLVSDRRV